MQHVDVLTQRSHRSLRTPGSLPQSFPLNMINTHDNIFIPELKTASLTKSEGLRATRSTSNKASKLRNPNVPPCKIKIGYPPPDTAAAVSATVVNERVISGSTSETPTESEVYYEASPVLPSRPYFVREEIETVSPLGANDAPNATFEMFEYRESYKFIHDTPERTRDCPKVLCDSAEFDVEVEMRPFGRPLAPDTTPLDLNAIAPKPAEIMIRKAAPFCNIYDRETLLLLLILEYEFDSMISRDEEDVVERGILGWVTRIRHSLFGYRDSEFHLSNPWASIFLALARPESEERDYDDDDDED